MSDLIPIGKVLKDNPRVQELERQGFIIKVIFDNDQRKIGSNHKGIIVADAAKMKELVAEHEISIAVLTVPASVAQKVCDELIESGVRAILNFAPVNLRVPDNVFIRNENMAIELEHLSFLLKNSEVKLVD